MFKVIFCFSPRACVSGPFSLQSLCLSAMAVESVTVVAPEVRAGPFILSKGLCSSKLTGAAQMECFMCLDVSTQLISWLSSGLLEHINNFQTLSLGDFPLLNLDPFLSIYDDYFYHTQNPRRPEVSIKT